MGLALEPGRIDIQYFALSSWLAELDASQCAMFRCTALVLEAQHIIRRGVAQ